jgi:broad specificity phosphatase PhoE
MTTSLCLICHPATPEMRAGRFPADEPLDDRGYAQAAEAGSYVHLQYPDSTVFCSPATSARQTADAFGLDAAPAPALADADYGAWRGKSMSEIVRDTPDDASAWLNDPFMKGHGGESFADVIKRVGTWLDALDIQGNVMAITHASVIRAALVHVMQAPPAAFFHVEPAPLSLIALRRGPRGWGWSLPALPSGHPQPDASVPG